MLPVRFSSDETASDPRNPALDRRSVVIGVGTGLGVLGLGGSALLRSTPALAAPQVGQAAPAFDATDTKGVARNLPTLKGKIVVLEWTNAECPYVVKHYSSSNMQKLQKEVTGNGAIWLSVISSAPGQQGYVDAAKANQLTSSRDAAPSGIILDPDGTIGRAYAAITTPHMYIIDQQGVLRYMGGIDSIASTQISDLDKAEPYFREAYLALIHGQPVKNAVTRPYGCSVKYSTV